MCIYMCRHLKTERECQFCFFLCTTEQSACGILLTVVVMLRLVNRIDTKAGNEYFVEALS